MTDNTTNTDKADAGSGSALTAVDAPEEHTEIDDLDEDLAELDDEDDDSGTEGVPGTGAVSGGFGFAGLALAVVSLTTNWTSSVVVSHSQYSEEVHAGSSGLAAQQQLNMYANGWHTQGWWAFLFALAAVLFGAGALVWPRAMRLGDAPSWARAAATGAIIVGLVGAFLAILTVTGVFGGHLTVPGAAG